MCRPARISRGRSSRSWIQRGVGRRAGVADQQRSPVAVLDRLLLGVLVGGRAVVVEPEVAVGVDQAGHDPALAAARRRPAARSVIRPSTTYRSRASPSGRTGPETSSSRHARTYPQSASGGTAQPTLGVAACRSALELVEQPGGPWPAPTPGPRLEQPVGGHHRDPVARSAAGRASATIVSSPSPGACTVRTCPSRPARTPPLARPRAPARPRRTACPRPAAPRAAGGRRRPGPSTSRPGRAADDVGAVDDERAGHAVRAVLEELGEVLGQVEGRGGLLVVDLLASGLPNGLAAAGGGLLLRRLGLCGRLGGVAGDPLALALLGLRLAALAAAGHAGHARHPGHAAAAGHLTSSSCGPRRSGRRAR